MVDMPTAACGAASTAVQGALTGGLTLRQLRYFEALVEQRHFGRAARACAISQPALSTRIRELEAVLGAPLFERSARSVRLTPFGETLAGRVRDILRAVDELGDLARATHERLTGPLRLGLIPTVAPYLLPGLVAELAGGYPDLEPHFRETTTPGLVAELLDGRLDAAVVALPVGEPALVETAVFTEEFMLVRPAGEAADEGARALPGRDVLEGGRLLLLEEGHCFRDQALAYCRTPTAASRMGLDASSLSTLVRLVEAGHGMTLIPEMAVATEARTARVSLSRLAPPAPFRTIGLVWRRTSPLSDLLAALAETVRRAAGSDG